MNIEYIRTQFPILERNIKGNPLVYLDNAATTQKPLNVIEGIRHYYENTNANIHRGLHTLSHESTLAWEEAHKTVARFINAKSYEEIVFTRNTTESLNFVVNTYGRQNLKSGDVIIISEMEHHSNIVPWQILAKEKGLKLEWIPVLDNYKLDFDYLDFLIRKYKSKLKILSITQISNVLGTENDIKYLAERIHSVGGVICVDAAQSVAHMNVDVQDLDCDFLCFSGHKMYASTGIGVICKKQLLESLEPWQGGGEMISKVWKTGATWNDLPWKFEAGTPHIEGGISLANAVEWMNDFSWIELMDHEKELMSTALEGLKSISGVKIFGVDDDTRMGVLSFTMKNLHPHDLASLLDEDGIAIRAGFHCAEPLHNRFNLPGTARVSFAIYNTVEEVRIYS
jgi:cysteine desulfurase/selenocysteine lyase